MAIDKIKRSLIWMRKTLGIIEKTTLPGEILGEVRPTIEALGWFRYEDVQVDQINAAAPATAIASSTPPAGVLRFIIHTSLAHTDTGITHLAGLNKRRNPGNFNIGLPIDQVSIQVGQFCSLIGRTFLVEGELIIGEVVVPPIGGVLSLRSFFVDIEPGEYIPPL